MSSEPGNLKWLDRLNAKLPSYVGYLAPAGRDASDSHLRELIALRLDSACKQLDQAIAECRSHETDREVGSLEAIKTDLITLADRVRRAVIPAGLLQGGALNISQAEVLHELDHALLEAADGIADAAARPSTDHDWLPNLMRRIKHFEAHLDQRILTFSPPA